MAHEDLKRKNKGARSAVPVPQDYAKLYNECVSEGAVGKGKTLSLQEILENAAVVNALCDILVEDGVIAEKDGIKPHTRIEASQDLYGGLLAGLIMILQEDGIIDNLEEKLECGILAAHRAMIHFGTRMVTLETVIAYRQEAYKAELAKRRKLRGG